MGASRGVCVTLLVLACIYVSTHAEICTDKIDRHLTALPSRSSSVEQHMNQMIPGSLCKICMAAASKFPTSENDVDGAFDRFFGNTGISFSDEEVDSFGAADGREVRGGAIAYRFKREQLHLKAGGGETETISHYIARNIQYEMKRLGGDQGAPLLRFCLHLDWHHPKCRAFLTKFCTDGGCCSAADADIVGSDHVASPSALNRCRNGVMEGATSEESGSLFVGGNEDDPPICAANGNAEKKMESISRYACSKPTESKEELEDRLRFATSDAVADKFATCNRITNAYCGNYILDVKKCSDEQLEVKENMGVDSDLVTKVLDRVDNSWRQRSFPGFVRTVSSIFAPAGEGQMMDRFCTALAIVAARGGVLTNDINLGRMDQDGAYVMCMSLVILQTGIEKERLEENVKVFEKEFWIDIHVGEVEYVTNFRLEAPVPGFVDETTVERARAVLTEIEDLKKEKLLLQKCHENESEEEIERCYRRKDEPKEQIDELLLERKSLFHKDPYWGALYDDAFIPPNPRSEQLTSPRSIKTGLFIIGESNVIGALPPARFRESIQFKARLDAEGCLMFESLFSDEQALAECRKCKPDHFKFFKKKCMGFLDSTKHPTVGEGECGVYSKNFDNKICVDRPFVGARHGPVSDSKCFEIETTGEMRIQAMHGYARNSSSVRRGYMKFCTTSYLEARDWVAAINGIPSLEEIYGIESEK